MILIEQDKTLTVVVLLFVTGITTFIGAFVTDLPANYRLSTDGVVTEGVVTAKEREQHQRIWAEYKVNNRKFKTSTSASFTGKSFEALDVGDKVPVFYNPSNSEEATLGNPQKYLRSSIILTCVFAILPLIFFVVYSLKNRSKNSNNEK